MTELEPTPKRPFLKTVFLSPDEPRLRAGWRLAIQTVMLLVFSFCAGIPISLPTVMTLVIELITLGFVLTPG